MDYRVVTQGNRPEDCDGSAPNQSAQLSNWEIYFRPRGRQRYQTRFGHFFFDHSQLRDDASEIIVDSFVQHTKYAATGAVEAQAGIPRRDFLSELLDN